jgi:hypothetical protein
MKKILRAFLAVAAAFAVLGAAVPTRALTLDKAAVLKNIQAVAGARFAADFQAPPVGEPVSVRTEEAGPSARSYPGRTDPDWTFTPGRLCTPSDPDFKEYRYPEHIAYCNRDVTPQMKQEVAAHYGIPQSEWGNYEFDHLIPLCIGGDSHVDNLWPQPRGNPNGSDDKDKLENQLYQEMKAGTITQAEAVRQIYAWFGATPTNRIMIQLAARPNNL